MATVTTNGWDLLGVANQTALNQFLTNAYNDSFFPSTISYSAFGFSFSGTMGIPVVDLNPTSASGNNTFASLTIPLSGNLVQGSDTYPIPSGSTLVITSNLTYVQIDISGTTNMQLYLDLTGPATAYVITLNSPPPAPWWEPVLNGIIQGYMQNTFQDGTYYLGTLNVSSAPQGILPSGSIGFSTQVNASDASNNVLVMMGTTSTGTSGSTDWSSVPPLMPSGQSATLYISNRCLLNNFVLPSLQGNISGSQFSITGNATTPYVISLTNTVNFTAEYNPVLQSLNTYVNDSGQIQGDYVAFGYPVSWLSWLFYVKVEGSFYLTPEISGQAITMDVDSPDGDGSLVITGIGWALYAALLIATFGSISAMLAAVIAVVVPVLAATLSLNVSMSNIAAILNQANVSFTWPASSILPLSGVSLPGDMILELQVPS
ncbi:MAG: hypothetical protein FD123_114 [Bacteroidetes bacterium]|nr:MAG: hypothetical protein FD123_114 [Bacteroidota bacterium]